MRSLFGVLFFEPGGRPRRLDSPGVVASAAFEVVARVTGAAFGVVARVVGAALFVATLKTC